MGRLSQAWVFASALMTAQPALAAPTIELQVDALEFEGDLDTVRRERFNAAVRDELAETHRIVDRTKVAKYAVQGRVRAVERDFEIELRAVELADGREVATARQLCELCGLAEALSTAESLAATLATKIEALTLGPPTVRITATPADAVIRIDGEVVGTSELERELTAGEHELRANKKGYVTETRRVTSIRGTHEDVHFELSPSPRRQPKKVAGWTVFGVGTASLGVGIAFIAIDGTPVRLLCSGDNIDANGNCRFEHRTRYLGIGLATGGAALIATGLALAVRRRGDKRSRARLQPSLAGLQWRF